MTARNNNIFNYEDFREDGKMILFVLSLVALFLSFYAPIFVFEFLGFTGSVASFKRWLQTLQIGWRITYIIIHMSVGLLMVISVATVIFTLVKLLITGLFQASKWLIDFITTTIETIVNLIVGFISSIMKATIYIALFPVRITAGTAYAAISHVQQKHQTEQELRRSYQEDHFEYFKSFHEFRKFFDALQRGEEPIYPKEKIHKEPPQHRKKKAIDPYFKALDLFGLEDPFTEQQFKARYRQLMMQCHPDLTRCNQAAQELNAARAIIKERKGWK